MENKKLEFYGGEWMSFLPFGIFIVLVVINTLVFKSISDGALWVPGFLALTISFFFAKDKNHYSQVIIRGIANEETIVPVVCWIFAGVFSRILRSSNLAMGLAGLSMSIGIKGSFFIVISFISSAIFATASGTGFGTIATGMGVLFPAGLALGCHPGLLAGSIISGAAFGDNLAPVSDTTICSASSLGVDIPGVVRSRLKYALSAGLLTIIGIIIIGSRYSGEIQTHEILEYDPKTLVMLIPVAITIYIAIKSGNIITATTIGSVISAITAIAFGLIDFIQIDPLEGSKAALVSLSGSGLDRTVDGIIYQGLNSMIQVILLALLLFASIQIMREGRGDVRLLESLSSVVNSARGAEGAMSLMVIILSSLMGLNAPAILAIGPSFAKPLAKKYGISPYRMANILDGQSNTLVYALPWTPAIIYTLGFAKDTGVGLTAVGITPYVLYAYSMIIVMTLSIIFQTGNKGYEK